MKAARRAPLTPALGPVEIIEESEVQQGSDEWLALRLGIPTASNFALVRRDSDSKTREEYMMTLAGEILSGIPGEGKAIVTEAMKRGNNMEPEARGRYAQTNFGDVERVGFMRRTLPSGRYVGASPDALVGKRKGGLEIKTMMPKLLIPRLIKGAGVPPEHLAQIYGTMWVGDLDFVDFFLFYRGHPFKPVRLGRDEGFIKEISDAVEVFDHDLHKLVARIRAMGGAR